MRQATTDRVTKPKQLNVAVDPRLHQAAKVAAARQGTTLQDLVALLLRQALLDDAEARPA
jgi:predicted HicB family RNase H-like nuclease